MGRTANCFVTNLGTNDIAVFQSNGSYVGSFSVAGTWRLTLDNSQNLYVAAGSDVIAYNTSGMPLRTIANGFGDAIATTRRQELISVENGVVTIFDRKGQSIFSYTQDQQGLQFAGGSMAIDRRTLYYATGPKGAPSVIVKYKLADFVTGTPNELVSFPNHGAYNPTQIAVDSRKCVYVVGYANTNGRGARTMIKMDPTGHIVLHISNLAFAYGVALDPAGNIYISENDNNDVKVFNSAGVLINTIQ